jgi:Uma2 family endonuclease
MSASPASPPRRMTPEEFELLPDAHRWELIDGELVERNMSIYSSMVAYEINLQMGPAVRQARGFGAQSDGGLRIFPWRPKKVVFPDGCYFSRERLPHGTSTKGWSAVAPDLVLEVVSPGDHADELADKILDYFRAGVRMVWVVYPVRRAVFVYRPDGPGLMLTGDAVLTGEDVLPGFEAPIASFFPEHLDSEAEDGEVSAQP